MIREILRGLVDLVSPSFCPGCDDALPIAERGFCELCASLLERRGLGPAAYDYGGPLADGIKRLKYSGRVDLVAPLGELLAEAASMHLGKVDAVVPVPLHPRRLAERGFNQSELLAESVSARLSVPLQSKRLWRVRDTPPQASLDHHQRHESVRGAFEARRDADKRVLLVDDVRTTGATMRAACAALYLKGATEVRVLALAGQD